MQNLRQPQFVLFAIAIAAVAPFLNKAFYVDDPLFIWIAQQIVKHPLDPYGFDVNWSSFVQPMSTVMQNPPVCSYYIAAIGRFFGWSEPVLHSAFLFWVVMVLLGTFAVARRFCREPLTVALFLLFTPVFLVSATSVMCDVMMLAFWTWAVEFWLVGLDRPRWWRFLVSALLISLAALTKYFGVALVPLLAVYTLLRDRRFALRLVFLLIPLAVLSNYEFVTAEKYGHGLLTTALGVSSSVSSSTRPSHFAQLLIGLSFCGGCLITTQLLGPFRGKKFLLAGLVAFVVFAVGFKFLILSWIYLETAEVPVWLEGGLFAVAGIAILLLTIVSVFQQENADTLLLLLWIFGTFVFAAFFNWSITARTFLPMAPAVAILTIRYCEQLEQRNRSKCVALAASAALSISLALADYRQANCARAAAAFYRTRYAVKAGHVRFLGHWGFQYYMQEWGAKPFDRTDPRIAPGQVLIGPFADLNIKSVEITRIATRDESTFKLLPFISTSAIGTGASFYSSFGGPLPWVVNIIPPDRYYAVTAE